MTNAESGMLRDGSFMVPRGDQNAGETGRICDRALGLLSLARARLEWLGDRSTSERLPAGHWLVIAPENLLERLVELTDHMHSVVKGLQTAFREPKSAPSQGHDLVARLCRLCRQFLADTGIECELDVDAQHASLGQRACEIVYWALSELLTNVRRHAHATRVRVSSGTFKAGFVYFRVEDDGVGLRNPLPPTALETGGLGLWNIESHLNELGGSMEIANGSGLCVTIALPC